MTRKKMGRPPAQWVHQLAAMKRDGDEYLDYQQLSSLFDVSTRTLHGFCSKADIKGEYYYSQESKAIRKRYKVKDLRDAARAYLAK